MFILFYFFVERFVDEFRDEYSSKKRHALRNAQDGKYRPSLPPNNIHPDRPITFNGVTKPFQFTK